VAGTSDPSPVGATAPTAREIQAIGAHGSLAGSGHRIALMNQAGQAVAIPTGGWGHGQSRLFASTSRPAILTWKAYSFLAPGGAAYEPARSVAAQSGQTFGCRSALQFLAHRTKSVGEPLDLNGIVTAAELNHVEWVRSAKVRVAEALFLERLLEVTRELLPPSGLHE
jgi:hypothetical protein